MDGAAHTEHSEIELNESVGVAGLPVLAEWLMLLS